MDEIIEIFNGSVGVLKKLFFKALLIDVVLEFLPILVVLGVTIPLVHVFGNSEITKNISVGISLVFAMPLVMFFMSAKWAMVYSCHDDSRIEYKSVFNRAVSMTIPFTLSTCLVMFYGLLTAIPGMSLAFLADTVLHQRLGLILVVIPWLFLFYKLGYVPIISTYNKVSVFDAVKASVDFTKNNILAKKVYGLMISLLLINFLVLSIIEMLLGDKGILVLGLEVLSHAIFGFLSMILLIRFWIISQDSWPIGDAEGSLN